MKRGIDVHIVYHYRDMKRVTRAKPPNWNWSGQILINY